MNYANEAANKAKEQYSKQRKFIEERGNSFTTVFDFVRDVTGFWPSNEVVSVKHQIYYNPEEATDVIQYEKKYIARDLANRFEYLEYIEQVFDLLKGLRTPHSSWKGKKV